MRKLVLVMLVALALPAAASAVPAERGDGTLAVKNATGRITIAARGALLGRVEEGVFVVADLSPGGNDEIQVFGNDQKPQVRGNGTTVYRGTDMRFRVVGGLYSVSVTGSGINVSAVGRGTVQGIGMSDGLFSSDGAPFKLASPLGYSDSFGQ
jgi:hypothetical protein